MRPVAAPGRLLRLASLAALLLVAPQPSLGDAPEGAAGDGRTIRLLGRPRQIAARVWGDLTRIAPRPGGGFLVAYTGDEALLVGEHAEDGSREAVRRLGSLGYSGSGNLRTLESLDADSWVAAWDRDHHYAGFLASHRLFVDGARRHAIESRHPAPVMVADGTGGAIGFVHGPRDVSFGRWDATGRLLRQRPLPGRGAPLHAVALGGGGVVSSAGHHAEASVIEWFTGAGKWIEGARGQRHGHLVSDGEDRLAELLLAPARRRVLGRFGASPSRLDEYRVLAEASPGSSVDDFGLAINRRDEAVLAWSLWPVQAACGIWVQGFERDGQSLSEPACAAPPGADSAMVAARPDGRFWLAWSTRVDLGAAELTQIWVQRLELAASP